MDSDERTDEPTVITREFDTDAVDPNVGVVSAVADIESTTSSELPPLYHCIDHLLEHLFANPPAADANARVTFTYYDYRVTITQDGTATFEELID